MFCKKGVLRKFVKFTGKHPCQSLFFNKYHESQNTGVDLETVSSEDNESYYRRASGIPLMNALVINMDDRMADCNHTELFSLLPTVCLSQRPTSKTQLHAFCNHLQLTNPLIKHLTFFRAR